MGGIIEIDPQTLPAQIAVANAHTAMSGSPIMARDEGQGFWANTYDTYMHESWIGNVARYGMYAKDKDPFAYDYDIDSAFNPYKFFVDRREDYSDLEVLMRNGGFDDIVSEAQFQDRAARLRKEMAVRQRISEGDALGAIVGGFLSLADVTILLPPVKALQVGKTANSLIRVLNSKIARGSMTGLYMSAVQEAGLHTMQELRTIEESALNTAFAAGFGGGIGLLASAAHPSSLLHPKNPNYVFKPESRVMMGIKRFGDSVSESAVVQPVIKGTKRTFEVVGETPLPGGGSVGAAAVKGVDLLKAGSVKGKNVLETGVKAVGKAGTAVTSKVLNVVTPIGRGLSAASERVRDVTAALYDLGGTLIDAHAKGKYVRSLEDTANGYQTMFDTRILVAAREAYVKLQMRLAELQGNRISPTGVALRDTAAAVKGLGSDVAAGTGRSGEVKSIDYDGRTGNLQKFEFEDIVERAMRGDITDEMLENLRSRFGDDGADTIINAATRMGEEIHAHNKMIEDKLVESGLISEADRMGREYVAPQLWSSKGIRKNKAEARRFFMELFAGRPTDEFLVDYGITQEQFAKLGREEVKIGDTTYSVETGLSRRNEILSDWTGDIYNNQLAQLEFELKNAEIDLKAKRQEVVLAARDLRKTATDIKEASIDEAIAILKARSAEREAAKLRLDKMRLEKTRLEQELKLAQQRMQQEDPIGLLEADVARRAQRPYSGQVKEAEALLNLIQRDPNSTKAEVAAARDNLTGVDIEVYQAQLRKLADELNTPKGEQRKALLMQRLQEDILGVQNRINALNKDIYKVTSQLQRLDPQLTRLSESAARATQARQTLTIVKKLRNQALKEQRAEAGKAKTAVKQAARRLSKAEKTSPVTVYVDELVDALASRHGGKPPLGLVPGDLFESGRTKRRMIRMNNEQLREAQRLGLIQNNLFGSLHQGHSDVAKRIALREVFGHHGGSDDDIVKSVIKSVEDDYDRLIDRARQDGKSQRYINKLENEKRKFTDPERGDIVRGFQRQMGVLDLPNDPESMLGYLVSKAREYNFIRYGSGFLIPSLTDLSNVVLTTGFGTFSYKNAKALNRTIEGMANPEIRRMAVALEMLMHNSRNMRINSVDDMRNMSGIGDYGTMKHYTTSTVDRVFNGLSQSTTYMSGMLWWNTRLKMLSMVEMQHNFVGFAEKYDELLSAASAGDKKAENQIAQLASLGLGADQMRPVQAMLKKHPPAEYDGVYELGMGRWLEEGELGQEAYQNVLNALEHTANRAIMTPGKGDTPFLMSNNFWKMVLQFQTYGFTIMNRYMMPAFQRMANYGDMEAFLSMGLAVTTGSAVVSIKDILNDGKIKERSAGQWAYDVIDRSGFTTYLSTYISAAARSFGAETSRYSSERNRAALVFGATGGLVQDVWDFAAATSEGDLDRMGKTAQKLAPYRILNQLYDIATGDK